MKEGYVFDLLLKPYTFNFRGHKDKIFVIKWNPQNTELLVTAGMKHIKFWTQTGGGFTSKRGTFGSAGKAETMMCATYGKSPDLVFSGGASGKVYIWQGNALKNTVQAHEGPVFAMQVLEKVTDFDLESWPKVVRHFFFSTFLVLFACMREKPRVQSWP